MPTPSVPPGPVTRLERIETLDILRGCALFGILVVNMAFFSQPSSLSMMKLHEWSNPLDFAVSALIAYVAEGKFIAMFSFLFGLGFAIQQERAESRGTNFSMIYLRRITVLLAFGLFHAALIWEGDILVFYAVCGFVLFFFRNCRPRTVLIWAAIFLALGASLYLGIGGLVLIASIIPGASGPVDQAMAAEISEGLAAAERTLHAYGNGSWMEILEQRIENVLGFYLVAPFFVPSVMCLFLCGMWAGKMGIFRDLSTHSQLLRRVLVVGLGVGAVGSLTVVVGLELPRSAKGYGLLYLSAAVGIVGAAAFGLAYVSGITLLAQQPKWRQRLALVAPVGRMALTNYILESVICTSLFYSFGLEWFGKYGPATTLLISVGVFAVLIPWSHWWLGRFEFGPLEWVWRSLTYGQWFPNTRRQPT